MSGVWVRQTDIPPVFDFPRSMLNRPIGIVGYITDGLLVFLDCFVSCAY